MKSLLTNLSSQELAATEKASSMSGPQMHSVAAKRAGSHLGEHEETQRSRQTHTTLLDKTIKKMHANIWMKESELFPSDATKIERLYPSLTAFIPLSLSLPINPVFLDSYSLTVECCGHSLGTKGSALSHSSNIDQAFYNCMCWPVFLCWTLLDV